MNSTYSELQTSLQLHGMILPGPPASGTEDDDDDRDDEHAGENEAPVRAIDEATEAPEEFDADDKDELGYSGNDDADEYREGTAGPER